MKNRLLPLAAISALLTACAGEGRRPSVENLDQRTGLTVASLPEPIDFIAVGAPSPGSTPSALKHASHCLLGPVEWDRMGEISEGLWLHVAPGSDKAVGDIHVAGAVSLAYDGGTLVLQTRAAPQLGREPYTPLVPWGQTAYFDLNADTLARLAASRELKLILRGTDSSPVVFDAVGATSATLKAFARSRGVGVD